MPIEHIITNDDLNVVHDNVNSVVDKLDTFTFVYNDTEPSIVNGNGNDIFNVDRFIEYNNKLRTRMENIKLQKYDEAKTESYFLTLILH